MKGDLQLWEKTEDTAQTESRDIQYVMYPGTNDKDTNEPVFPPEDSKKEAEKILIQANETTTEFYAGEN